MMVLTGRLELPRLSPLPPQGSVSTNSTTWAILKVFEFLFCNKEIDSITLLSFLQNQKQENIKNYLVKKEAVY